MKLTQMEKKVISAIIDHKKLCRKEIAQFLGISQNTVASHLLHLNNKLGTCSMLELVFYVLEKRGLI